MQKDWMENAYCRGVEDDSVFFPTEYGTEGIMRETIAKYCAHCDVTEECLEFALSFPVKKDADGVFGGRTPRDRLKIRNARRTLRSLDGGQ